MDNLYSRRFYENSASCSCIFMSKPTRYFVHVDDESDISRTNAQVHGRRCRSQPTSSHHRLRSLPAQTIRHDGARWRHHSKRSGTRRRWGQLWRHEQILERVWRNSRLVSIGIVKPTVLQLFLAKVFCNQQPLRMCRYNNSFSGCRSRFASKLSWNWDWIESSLTDYTRSVTINSLSSRNILGFSQSKRRDPLVSLLQRPSGSTDNCRVRNKELLHWYCSQGSWCLTPSFSPQ